ncbi:hypothetical protein [Evansella clarkii]|uniref:hypothetical protein n=1 Tax=Evansella clarkii TaxID=79879 RepID=UPI00099714CD|nr:hypothetical protein [Evansella clarkii]
MSEFDIGLDIEAELAGIRGQNKEKSEKPEVQPKQVKPAPEVRPEGLPPKHGGGDGQVNSGHGSELEPEALTHSHGGEDASSSSPSAVPSTEKRGAAPPIDWKRFKTLSGIFEHVGGDRPVRLNPNIKRLQVSGIPDPLIAATQKRLKENHTGAVVSFPWGEYEITERNRVFTTKSSLLRYLLFDSFRDAAGTHVQYAKQWLVLQHPVFDEGFNPETHLGAKNDELDIYALLFVAHTSEEYESNEPSSSPGSEQDYQTAERLGMVNMGIGRVLDKLDEQEKLFRAYAERSTIMQTVVLLDRMGLLNGGLPRDVGEFVRVLEENRDTLIKTDQTISTHIQTEKERQKMFARQERLRKMQQRDTR